MTGYLNVSNAQSGYFVATDGSDSYDGLYPAYTSGVHGPFLTFAKASSVVANGGKVYVRGGTYNEKASFTKSILFSNYNGETVILDGTGVTITNYGGIIEFNGTSGTHLPAGVEVTGITCQYVGQGTNYMYNAIYGRYADGVTIHHCITNDVVNSGIMLRNCANISIHDNLVKNSSHATVNMDECISLMACTDGLVYNNEVHSADITPMVGMNIGINAKAGCARIYIFNNHCHDLVSSGVYTDAWNVTTEDIYIYNNKVHDCHYGVACNSEAGGLLQRVYMYNNLCYNIGWVGAYISSGPGERKDIYIFNNTLAKTTLSWFSALRVETSNLTGTIYIKNNACYWHRPDLGTDSKNGQFMALTTALAKITASNNIVYGENDYQVAEDGMIEADDAGQETWADPLFTDWAMDDYTIGASSPCRNGGTIVGLPFVPATDYLGNTRVCGAAIDAGCYEYQE